MNQSDLQAMMSACTAVFQNLATAESESHDQYEQSDQPVRSNHFRFPLSCCKVLENRNRKVESGSDWSELVGQIAHIDHVTRFLQLQDFGKPLYMQSGKRK